MSIIFSVQLRTQIPFDTIIFKDRFQAYTLFLLNLKRDHEVLRLRMQIRSVIFYQPDNRLTLVL